MPGRIAAFGQRASRHYFLCYRPEAIGFTVVEADLGNQIDKAFDLYQGFR
jgi:hypothetical protein